MNRPTISALGSGPDFVHGFVKDLRVRWALEEAGIDYDVELIAPGQGMDSPYRAKQPFGQVPTYRDDTIKLFESGAILLYLGRRYRALMPSDEAGEARAAQWVFAATTSIQPLVDCWNEYRGVLDEQAFESLQGRLFERLLALSQVLEGRAFLEDTFSVGDLMMSTVLREVASEGALDQFPILADYHRRLEARPAFSRALKAHLHDIGGSND